MYQGTVRDNMVHEQDPRSGRHHTRMANKLVRYANPVSPKDQTWPKPIRPWTVLAMAAVAMQAEGADSFEHQMTFDTDSSPIRVDNICTRCISHQIEDFEGPLINTGRQIKGFGGS